jgi:hypothetical protein
MDILPTNYIATARYTLPADIIIRPGAVTTILKAFRHRILHRNRQINITPTK